ncbi:hypothetical protein H5410_047968 [Solanum commersonii]|uniref:Uncharacterized protein n=1 Tax=Solanum commersonii TaxID=4109 RepID=A0A9J5XK93_SOLCO|nr:hypothetical protein H5410_047968 [Solanum commersonii]
MTNSSHSTSHKRTPLHSQLKEIEAFDGKDKPLQLKIEELAIRTLTKGKRKRKGKGKGKGEGGGENKRKCSLKKKRDSSKENGKHMFELDFDENSDDS